MQSSAYYASKVQEFKNIKSSISSLFSVLSKCVGALKSSITYTDNIKISGETIDKGDLSKMSSSLGTVSSNLTAITSECDEKIVKYQALYEKALAWEREQAAKAARERLRTKV